MKRIAKVHWIIYLKPLSILAIGGYIYNFHSDYIVFTYLILLTGIIFLFKSLWYVISNRLSIDSSYVTLKKGVFSTVKDRVPIEKIENFRVFKSVLGNILNYGTIRYGNDSSYPSFKYISNPDSFLIATDKSEENIVSIEKSLSKTRVNFSNDALSDFECFIPHIPKSIYQCLKLISAKKFDSTNFKFHVGQGHSVSKGDVIATLGCINIKAPFDGMVNWIGSSTPGIYEWNDEKNVTVWEPYNGSQRIFKWIPKTWVISCPKEKDEKHFYMYSIIPTTEVTWLNNFWIHYSFDDHTWPNGPYFDSVFTGRKHKFTTLYGLLDRMSWALERQGQKLPDSFFQDSNFKTEILKYHVLFGGGTDCAQHHIRKRNK
jgi:hypothetical protein